MLPPVVIQPRLWCALDAEGIDQEPMPHRGEP